MQDLEKFPELKNLLNNFNVKETYFFINFIIKDLFSDDIMKNAFFKSILESVKGKRTTYTQSYNQENKIHLHNDFYIYSGLRKRNAGSPLNNIIYYEIQKNYNNNIGFEISFNKKEKAISFIKIKFCYGLTGFIANLEFNVNENKNPNNFYSNVYYGRNSIHIKYNLEKGIRYDLKLAPTDNSECKLSLMNDLNILINLKKQIPQEKVDIFNLVYDDTENFNFFNNYIQTNIITDFVEKFSNTLQDFEEKRKLKIKSLLP